MLGLLIRTKTSLRSQLSLFKSQMVSLELIQTSQHAHHTCPQPGDVPLLVGPLAHPNPHTLLQDYHHLILFIRNLNVNHLFLAILPTLLLLVIKKGKAPLTLDLY